MIMIGILVKIDRYKYNTWGLQPWDIMILLKMRSFCFLKNYGL